VVTDATEVPDLEEFRARARAWLAANMERRDGPAVARRDADHYTPEVIATNRARQRKLFDAGLAGLTWPKEYGGQGLPDAFESAFGEEAAPYEMPDFGVLTGTTFGICVPTMIAHGSPELLARFVPLVLAGDALVCQFFSEPSSGSDLAGARTRATRDGDDWVLNGQKIWSTFAHLADYGMCLARTDWEQPKHRGLTWFVVPCHAPGVTIRPIRQINENAEFCEDFFDDVIVPDADRIGDVNGGWAVTQTMLVLERGAGRPTAVGAAAPRLRPGAFVPDLLGVAERAGRADDPLVRQDLARAHTNDFVGRALAARIGEMASTGQLNAGVAAYGKLFQGTYLPLRARLGMDIGRGGAMTWDPDDPDGNATSLAYLNGRLRAIAGGTNEVQRNGIGERALGLPREPSFDTNKPFSEVVRDAKDWTGQI
jgi:alkylation response protein AidB-like acyl-CoA dehydrogenase